MHSISRDERKQLNKNVSRNESGSVRSESDPGRIRRRSVGREQSRKVGLETFPSECSRIFEATGANVIKRFPPFANAMGRSVSWCVFPGKPSQPSITFTGKVGAYPCCAPLCGKLLSLQPRIGLG